MGNGPTIRQKIAMAKKVWVFLDPDYRQHDGFKEHMPMMPVSRSQALRICDMSPRDNPPFGNIDEGGKLILHPPYAKRETT